MGGGGGGGNDKRFWEEKERIDQIEPSDFAFQTFSTGIPAGLNYRQGLENDTMGEFGVGDPVNPGLTPAPTFSQGLTPEMLLELERAEAAQQQATAAPVRSPGGWSAPY
jgi:hypothetical protein